MHGADDLDYYRLREAQERENADRTHDAAAKRIHLQMAERYFELSRGLERNRSACA